jgi:non-canonical purine NTP pyrophosphatase (RdgB/HAM1 family)
LRRAVLVTGNPNKLAEARRVGAEGLEAARIDLPEIQSLSLREVLRAKGQEAWRRLERPLIVEETSLELDALNGFPAPLVKWMLTAVGAEAMARIALDSGGDRAVARCGLMLLDRQGEVLVEGRVEGRLVSPGRGEGGFGWDPVFQPDGFSQTFGELSAEAKDEIGHRGKAWRALIRRLEGVG